MIYKKWLFQFQEYDQVVETTFYLKKVMQRVTYLGAIMLSILATLPNLIEAIYHGSSFNGLGTTSLLILVGVILELSREIRSIILIKYL